jgi:hypothetical protein
MYDDFEVMISRRYLDKITEVLDEPIVMLGGWAVYLSVNENYRKVTGREYIGSRDIDLGFHMGESSKSQTLIDVIDTLEKELGFSPLSFRFLKEVHRETGLELDQETARRTPSYDIFPLYVDLIVDHIPYNFKETYGFNPVDETLLKRIFENENERSEITFLGKNLWLPSPNVLLATKVKSYPSRDKEHKRIKDMCDIISLLLFSKGWTKDTVVKLVGKEVFQKFKDILREEDMIEASGIIGIEMDLVKNAINKMIS